MSAVTVISPVAGPCASSIHSRHTNHPGVPESQHTVKSWRFPAGTNPARQIGPFGRKQPSRSELERISTIVRIAGRFVMPARRKTYDHLKRQLGSGTAFGQLRGCTRAIVVGIPRTWPMQDWRPQTFAEYRRLLESAVDDVNQLDNQSLVDGEAYLRHCANLAREIGMAALHVGLVKHHARSLECGCYCGETGDADLPIHLLGRVS